MVHLTDDVGANIPLGQHPPGCARDAIGSAISFWVHSGLGGWKLILTFEPFQDDVSGGEATGLAGEAHCPGVALTVGPNAIGGESLSLTVS